MCIVLLQEDNRMHIIPCKVYFTRNYGVSLKTVFRLLDMQDFFFWTSNYYKVLYKKYLHS